MANRIDTAFGRARREGRAAFMPFLTAGDPDLETTAELIRACAANGADVIELGVPFSDPIADGPTIQSSFVRALAHGYGVQDVLAMLRKARKRTNVPILTMVSYSIVERLGVETYFKQASKAGVDGVILPDLPADEANVVVQLGKRHRLHTVFLVAPTTDDQRMKMIMRRSKGFIYYVSVTGTTGARTELPSDLAEHIRRLKSLTQKPVAVGFGVSRPEQVRAVAADADGVIVGSAIVRKIHECGDRPREELVAEVGRFVRELASGTRRAPEELRTT